MTAGSAGAGSSGAAPDRPLRASDPSLPSDPWFEDAGDVDLVASLTRETRLLLASMPPEPDRDRLTTLLEEDPDWDRMLALLLRERAALPFWRRVRPLEGRLEPPVGERLEQLASVTEFRMRRLRTRLAETLEMLDEAGVPAVVLKGGALAHTLYPDWRERPMSDLDLLVPADRAEEAREASLSGGWARDDDRYPEQMYRRHYHLPPLRDTAGSGAALEIHTGLLLEGHPFAIDAETLRQRARPTRIAERRALVPEPVDHAVYLCLHFAWGHALQTGAWRTVRDLGVLAGAPGFSWEDFVRRTRQARAGPFVYWTLRLGRRLAGFRSPDPVREAFRPPLPDLLLRRLDRHLAAQLFVTEPGCPSVRLRQALWLLATRPSGGRPPGVRPWSYADDFDPRRPGDEADPARTSFWSRIRWHLTRPGAWAEYMARVLLPGSTGP